MSEEKDMELGIVSKADLGNGRKQVTFKVDPAHLSKYMDLLDSNNVNYEFEKNSPSYKGSKAYVSNRYMPNGNDWYTRDYNSNYKPYTYALETPIDPHRKIELSIELYLHEPLVASVIDMMVDFSSSGFVNECEDNDIKKIYDRWADEIKLPELIEQIFFEYWRSGNVSIYRSNKSCKIGKQQTKNGQIIKKEQYKFPAGYTILNPMNVYIEGPLLFNQERAYLSIGNSSVNSLNADNMNYMNGVPEINKNIDPQTGKIPLDPKFFSRITRKKQPYERYANPFLERVFEPVLFKQKLRLMDMSMVEGMVNQLVTVTVGNDEYPAGDEDLHAIAELFNTPNKAYTVFWNHTLEVKFHKPEGLEALAQDKYIQVNDDILAGLGINRALLDGGGKDHTSLSNGWVATLSLIERLDNTRYKVLQWLESEYRRIAEENNFPVYPHPIFNKMNLREDTYVSTVLLPMYDRGLLDEEDVLSETGHDYESIIETKKRNKKNSSLFLPPEQPFQGGNSSPNNGKPKSGAPQKPMKQRAPVTEKNKGNPPKSQAYFAMAYYKKIQEDYETELADSYNSIKNKVAQLVEQHKHKDPSALDSFLVGALIGLFASISSTSDKYIDDIYDSEIASLTDEFDNNKANEVKHSLKEWNESYVNKLAYDIKDNIIQNIDSGLDIKVAVNKAFLSNMYRVSTMSQSVAQDTYRQAKIQGNVSMGMSNATWVAHIDDRTCSTCTGLHGQTFNINDVPPRPHPNCRCDLDFN
jgi:SPP1 gp7 family putative phage head morphogenesis protein